jgi:hypothetical protein
MFSQTNPLIMDCSPVGFGIHLVPLYHCTLVLFFTGVGLVCGSQSTGSKITMEDKEGVYE